MNTSTANPSTRIDVFEPLGLSTTTYSGPAKYFGPSSASHVGDHVIYRAIDGTQKVFNIVFIVIGAILLSLLVVCVAMIVETYTASTQQDDIQDITDLLSEAADTLDGQPGSPVIQACLADIQDTFEDIYANLPISTGMIYALALQLNTTTCS